MQQHYAISATRDGFRRAGRVWRREATIVAAEDLTDVQLEMLHADPGITVTPCAPAGDAAATPTAAAEVRTASIPELRAELIQAACGELDRDNEEDFTSSGAPAVSALERVTGLATISATERDSAWLDHVEAGNAAAAGAAAGGAAG